MSEIKLDPEIKSKWIEALRSGRYEQGHGYLYQVDVGHCCLGVLAEVTGFPRENFCFKDCSPATILDDIGMQKLLGAWSDESTGFVRDQPSTHTTIQRKLAAMNDNGKSFAEIADWVETNL